MDGKIIVASYLFMFVSLPLPFPPSLPLPVCFSLHPSDSPPSLRPSVPPSLPPSSPFLFLYTWMNSGLSKLIFKGNMLDFGHYSEEFADMLMGVARSSNVLFSASTRQRKSFFRSLHRWSKPFHSFVIAVNWSSTQLVLPPFD